MVGALEADVGGAAGPEAIAEGTVPLGEHARPRTPEEVIQVIDLELSDVWIGIQLLAKRWPPLEPAAEAGDAAARGRLVEVDIVTGESAVGAWLLAPGVKAVGDLVGPNARPHDVEGLEGVGALLGGDLDLGHGVVWDGL